MLSHKTHTQTHHINQQDEPLTLPYPPAALLSLSPWVEQRHQQIMAPLLPYAILRLRAIRIALAVVGLLAWGGEMICRHQRIERVGVPWPKMAAVL